MELDRTTLLYTFRDDRGTHTLDTTEVVFMGRSVWRDAPARVSLRVTLRSGAQLEFVWSGHKGYEGADAAEQAIGNGMRVRLNPTIALTPVGKAE